MIPLAAVAAEDRWADLEAAVDATSAIAPWCSGPDWVQPVSAAFAADATPIILEQPGAGFAMLARHQAASGQDILAGLEPLWGFASPIFGSDLHCLANALATWLTNQETWSRLVLPGLPREGQLLRTLAKHLTKVGQLGLAEGITRQIVDLEQGQDAWLARRPTSFRRNLRNANRRANRMGLSFEIIDDHDNVFDRVLAIEHQSWKGRVGEGITSPEMGRFYQKLVARLTRRQRLRATIAILDGEDVGYILGGVRNRRYRGLQLSYTTQVRQLSVSHLLQFQEINRLTGEGVRVYDMGMDMDYKRRWADRSESSIVLVVDRY